MRTIVARGGAKVADDTPRPARVVTQTRDRDERVRARTSQHPQGDDRDPREHRDARDDSQREPVER
jgi:hypothetical protein